MFPEMDEQHSSWRGWVLCHMDSIIIFGKTQEEHDTRLHSTLNKIKAEGVILNKDKYEFHKSQLHFLGHIINKQEISPDPDKTAVILQMERNPMTELQDSWGWSTNWVNLATILLNFLNPFVSS